MANSFIMSKNILEFSYRKLVGKKSELQYLNNWFGFEKNGSTIHFLWTGWAIIEQYPFGIM